jgi:hypothetical protein
MLEKGQAFCYSVHAYPYGISKVRVVRRFRQLAEPAVSTGRTLDARPLPVERARPLPINLPPE